MSFAFERPVGATADVTELDYISALHQTDVQGGIRKDGSIQDTDISLFLSSRYGVNVSSETVRDAILNGLGSTDGCMDMMQLVSLLMIPTLRQAQQNGDCFEDSSGRSTNDDNDLLLFTVEMLLHDVTGSRQPKPLTSTLLKQILQAYGEESLAENDGLVYQMLQAAGATDGQRVLLDATTFLKALTADVQDFNVDNKDKLSTNYHDVMSDDTTHYDLSLVETSDTADESPESSLNEKNDKEDSSRKEIAFKRITGYRENEFVPTLYTAPQVDNTADTFRSRPLVIFQWTFFVLSFQTYLIRVLNQEILQVECTQFDPRARWVENAGAFFCTFGLNVLKWFVIMLAMSGIGLFYFWLGGIGNNIECEQPIYPLIGTVVCAICVFLPPVLFGRSPDDPLQQQFLEVVTAVLGAIASALTLWHCISLLIPKASQVWKWFKCILVPEAIRTEYNLKQAAEYKLNKMVKNALEVHRVKKQESVVPTHFGQALLNFAETSPQHERVGGLRWTMKSIWNRRLFRREGILFSGRIMSTNLIQFVVACFILIAGVVITMRAGEAFDAQWERVRAYLDTVVSIDVDQAVANTITDVSSTQFTDFLVAITDPTCPDDPQEVPSCNDVDDISLCIPDDSNAFCTLLDYSSSGEEINATVQTLLLNASGLDTVAIADAAADNIAMAVEGSIGLYFPTDRYMVVAPLAAGVLIAFLTAFFISAVVIPSASTTALKFRSGVLPFAHDPKVKLLRIAPDQTAFLRGLMYWGALFASILLGSVWAVIIFLYVWQVTAAAAQRITASLLAALTVIGLHILISRNIRKIAASAFYRKKPSVANITLLVRECGLVALTQGFVVVRILRLFLTTCFYIGRLDTPFLYNSVGHIGGYRVDGEPYMFQIDILQHEAHRHPFIETLGTNYLLKLRHGDAFCTVEGSTWRLIFVYVLMPWLSKYRAIRRQEPKLENVDESGDLENAAPLPPIRAVTLVDPQAYALRAASLVPVASGWHGGSNTTLGGRRLGAVSGGLSLLRDNQEDEEVRELREENQRLRVQLRLAEVAHSTERKRDANPESQTVLPDGPEPMDRIKPPDRRALRREESTGLETISPPKPRSPNGEAQVTWADYSEFEI